MRLSDAMELTIARVVSWYHPETPTESSLSTAIATLARRDARCILDVMKKVFDQVGEDIDWEMALKLVFLEEDRPHTPGLDVSIMLGPTVTHDYIEEFMQTVRPAGTENYRLFAERMVREFMRIGRFDRRESSTALPQEISSE